MKEQMYIYVNIAYLLNKQKQNLGNRNERVNSGGGLLPSSILFISTSNRELHKNHGLYYKKNYYNIFTKLCLANIIHSQIIAGSTNLSSSVQ